MQRTNFAKLIAGALYCRVPYASRKKVVFAIAGVMTAGIVIATAQERTGGIRGTVYDDDFGGPIPEAAIRISEVDRKQVTTEDGHFMFQDLRPGAYTLIISKQGYERVVKSRIVVVPGSLADVTARLKGEFFEMEEYVVRDLQLDDTATEAGLLALRETSLTFQDSIGRDLMSKAGAGDVAGALKLVTGASVADGKYATVRGLSDRYVGTTINGIRVPSSDPTKRAVQIDVIPASIVENMSVFKTFSPDLAGDWSGGGIDVRTLGMPDEPFVNVSFSRGVNSRYTGKPGFLTHIDGGTGDWGRHGGALGPPDEDKLPTNLGLAPEVLVLANEDNPQEILDLAAAKTGRPRKNFPEHDRRYVDAYNTTRETIPTMGTTRRRMPEDFGIKLSAGYPIAFGDGHKLGFIGAFSYDKKYDRKEIGRNSIEFDLGEGPFIQVRNDSLSFRDEGEAELKLGMLGAIGLELGDTHRFTLTGLRNRTATDTAQYTVSTNFVDYFYVFDTSGDDITVTTNVTINSSDNLFSEKQIIHYVERSIDSLQLKGEHTWPDLIGDNLGLEIRWHAARNVAEQEEPKARRFNNNIKIATPAQVSALQARGREIDPSLPVYDKTFQGTDLSAAGGTPLNALVLWKNTKEDNTQYALEAAVPFKRQVADLHASFLGLGAEDSVWAPKDGVFKVGAVWDWTRRWYEQRTYRMGFATSTTDSKLQQSDVDDLGGPEIYQMLNDSLFWNGTYWGPGNPGDPFSVGQLIQAYNDAAKWWEANTPAGRIYAKSVKELQKYDLHTGLYHFFTQDRDELWTDHFTGPDYVFLGPFQNQIGFHLTPIPSTVLTDVDYEGFQALNAGYWKLDMPVTKQLTFTLGARLELTDMKVIPKSRFDPPYFRLVSREEDVSYNEQGDAEIYAYDIGLGESTNVADVTTELLEASWLRSAGLVYELRPNMKFRYNWSQTIARPTFRELSAAVDWNFAADGPFMGNPDLELVTVRNTDVRWEWFPNPGDVFAVSWFKKIMEDPIEWWAFPQSGLRFDTPLNFEEGRVEGWEFEARKAFEHPLGLPGKLGLGANYTIIDAEVRMPYGLARTLEDMKLYYIPRGDAVTPAVERLLDEAPGESVASLKAKNIGDDPARGGLYYVEEGKGVISGWPETLETWRRMRNQPEYIYNVFATYDIEQWGTSFGIFGNVTGPMLTLGASRGVAGGAGGIRKGFPSIWRERVPSVDLSISQKLGPHLKLTFRAKDLNEPVIWESYRWPDFDNAGKSIKVMRSAYIKPKSYSLSISGEW